MEWYENPFGPATLTGWIVPDIHFNLSVLTLASSTAKAHHASISMTQEVNPAGTPADASDGSWSQVQSADVS
eukprot:2813551-Pyramimonas_sp.AAC.1